MKRDIVHPDLYFKEGNDYKQMNDNIFLYFWTDSLILQRYRNGPKRNPGERDIVSRRLNLFFFKS